MDTIRHYIALILIVSLPGSLSLWLIVHPFVKFWRSAGSKLTIIMECVLASLVAYVIFRFRALLLAIDFGTNYWLVAAAVPLIVVSAVLKKRIGMQLKFTTLIGLPEIAPNAYSQKLLTEGIYARIRHPRYVQVLLSVFAYALIANHLATYVLLLLAYLWVRVIVPIEEYELRHRYGEQWNQYAAGVPRFLPKRQQPLSQTRHHAA